MTQHSAQLDDIKRLYARQIAATARLSDGGLDRRLTALYAPDIAWRGCHPLNDIAGASAVAGQVWTPLLRAFPDLCQRTDIVLSGHFKDGDWVASTGHLVGLFIDDFLGIPATGRPAWLRFGAFERIENGLVKEAYWMFDLPGLMMQAGAWPLSASLGIERFSPSPESQDGITLSRRDDAECEKSLKLVEAMIAGLMQYDRVSLASMGMRRFWTPDFHWYGPAGIGAMRGHDDYERGHQGPFLHAFPDRVGGDHKCRVGDGAYVASTGWPSIRATHSGGGWMGLAPTGRPISMRVMDFWRRDGDLLVENWVFIDLVDLLLQMDVDVLGRMKTLRNVPPA